MKTLHNGQVLTIKFTDEADRQLEGLKEEHANEPDAFAQLQRMLERLGDMGKLQSPNQWRHEFDSIYAVKAKRGLRAYGKRYGHDFVVAYCTRKKNDKMGRALTNAVKKAFEKLDVELKQE